MNKIKVTIYHDVLCTWCYIAAKNFKPVKEEFQDVLDIRYRVWPLYPQKLFRGREKAKELILAHWEETKKYPGGEGINPDLMRSRDFEFPHSMPVLEAIKCAELQGGAEAHGRYFDLAQKALYEDAKNIDDLAVLTDLADEASLDIEQFIKDMAQGQTDRVMAEFEEAKKNGIRVIPTTVIGDETIFGAVPTEEFLVVVRRQLQQMAA